MANAIVEIVAPSGMALTLSLFAVGSDTAGASGKTLTERTNCKGTYRATVTEGLTGLHRAIALGGSIAVASGVVLMDNTASDHYVVDDANTRLLGGANQTGMDITPTAIQAGADAALVAVNLDHFMRVPVATGAPALDMTAEVADGTVLSYVLSGGNTSNFDTSHNDNLEAIGTSTSGFAASVVPIVDDTSMIRRALILLNTAVSSVTSQTVLVLATGSPNNSAYPPGSVVVIQDATIAKQVCVGTVASYVVSGGGTVFTLTLAADPGVFTIAAGDGVEIISTSPMLNLDARGITTANKAQTADSNTILAHADYGNAKLVRSTTPANTLSVDASHLVAVPATQKVDVDTIKTVDAVPLAHSQNTVSYGVVGSGSTVNSVVLASISPTIGTDSLKGKVLTFEKDTTTAALADQSKTVSANTSGSTPTISLNEALTSAPMAGDKVVIT